MTSLLRRKRPTTVRRTTLERTIASLLGAVWLAAGATSAAEITTANPPPAGLYPLHGPTARPVLGDPPALMPVIKPAMPPTSPTIYYQKDAGSFANCSGDRRCRIPGPRHAEIGATDAGIGRTPGQRHQYHAALDRANPGAIRAATSAVYRRRGRAGAPIRNLPVISRQLLRPVSQGPIRRTRLPADGRAGRADVRLLRTAVL